MRLSGVGTSRRGASSRGGSVAAPGARRCRLAGAGVSSAAPTVVGSGVVCFSVDVSLPVGSVAASAAGLVARRRLRTGFAVSSADGVSTGVASAVADSSATVAAGFRRRRVGFGASPAAGAAFSEGVSLTTSADTALVVRRRRVVAGLGSAGDSGAPGMPSASATGAASAEAGVARRRRVVRRGASSASDVASACRGASAAAFGAARVRRLGAGFDSASLPCGAFSCGVERFSSTTSSPSSH